MCKKIIRQSAHYMAMCEESCYNSDAEQFGKLGLCEVESDKKEYLYCNYNLTL